jgi:hypothetical protein
MALDEGGAGSLEQFILLAKNARGRACVALIQQVLSNKKLFVFRELLDMPNVSALENKEYHGYLELLKIFSSGTYKDYVGMYTDSCIYKLSKMNSILDLNSKKTGAASFNTSTGTKASKTYHCFFMPSIQGTFSSHKLR